MKNEENHKAHNLNNGWVKLCEIYKNKPFFITVKTQESPTQIVLVQGNIKRILIIVLLIVGSCLFAFDPFSGFLKGKKYLVHDRDRLYTKAFIEILESAGIEHIKSMPMAPNFSPFIERFIKSIKTECLDRMLIFGEAHLKHCVDEYVEHYHLERHHQGLDNQIIYPPPQGTGQIVCQERLGGLLKFYRKAA